MSDTPDLRDKITALFRDGSLYRESPQAIADAVLAVVEPLLTGAQLDVLERGKALDRAEDSRRDWAAEAARLDIELDVQRRRMARALNKHTLTPWDELDAEASRVAEMWLDSVAAELDREERDKHAVPVAAVCSCAGWSLPQCSVHEDSQGDSDV